MNQVLILAFMTTAVFCVFKFVEMKFLEKKNSPKPLKHFVRDLVAIFISSIIAGGVFFSTDGHISEFFNTITDAKVIPAGPTPAFTDAPGF